MSQVSNLDVQNGPGAQVRSDMNAVLAALFSQNSGGTAPSDTSPFMFWADTTANRLKIRNQADTAWITLPVSLTADATVPDALTLLENLAARKLLRLGASGAEWQLDPAAGGAGATLKVGPESGGAVQANLGITFNRATGAIEVGTSATAGAADHLKVNGGVYSAQRGFTCPDGTLLSTAGVRDISRVNYRGFASYSSTAWGVIGTTLRLVITPQRSTSRILVIGTVCGACQSHGFWRIHKNGSPLEMTVGSFVDALGNLYALNSKVPVTQCAAVFDTASPGVSVTYQIALKADSATYPVFLNNPYSTSGAAYEMYGLCSLVALEIGGS